MNPEIKLAEKERDGFLSSISNPSESPMHTYKKGVAMQWVEPIPITALETIENEKIDWIWEGFIAKAQLTLLLALWKVGKTTLVLWLLALIQSEGTLAGKKITPCKVLIITEESKSIWNRRREEFTLVDGIWISCRPTNHKMNSQQWEEFLENIYKFSKENGIELIIIDTLTTFWPVREENDAGQVSQALLPLNSLLNDNIAVLLIHHLRKSDGDEATGSRGSGVLPSSVDTIIEFRRFDPKNLTDNRRVLKSYSRFEETPPEVVLELTDDGYISQGSPQEVRQLDKLNFLLKLLPEDSEGKTLNQIEADWPEEEFKKPNRTTIFRWLKILEKKRQAFIIGKSEEKGKPDLWSKLESFALQPPSIRNAVQETPFDKVDRAKELLKKVKGQHRVYTENENNPHIIQNVDRLLEPIFEELSHLGVSRETSKAILKSNPEITDNLLKMYLTQEDNHANS